VAAYIAALLLIASAPPAGASVTIGQLPPGTPPGAADPSGHNDLLLPSVTSGNSYAVPGTGTITSWSHNAAADSGQVLAFKVFRHSTGSIYSVVGHDGPRSITGGALNTFPTSIAVKPGDIIGLSYDVPPPQKAVLFNVPEESSFALVRAGDLADGESGSFGPFGIGRRVNVTASFDPSNSFTLGKAKLNKKKGTATLTVTVPNPGELTGSGKGIKVTSAAGAVTSKTVTAPGEVKLSIRAKGEKKRKLNETGKVKVKPKITYTPTGGDPSTQSRKVKLKKR